MLGLTNGVLDAAVRRLGLPDRRPGELAVVGVRGAVPVDGTTIRTGGCGGTTDGYDDTIGVFGPAVRLFRASVDPGMTSTTEPNNPAGCAHLMNGAWRYRWGEHRGHPALVEAAPVRVWRDGERDGVREPGDRVETGIFGIHIHSGGPGPHVGPWSAGCQVIRSDPAWGEPWQSFVRLLQASGQREFTYYLFDACLLDAGEPTLPAGQ